MKNIWMSEKNADIGVLDYFKSDKINIAIEVNILHFIYNFQVYPQ